jgi:uncharacterized membrane protein
MYVIVYIAYIIVCIILFMFYVKMKCKGNKKYEKKEVKNKKDSYRTKRNLV